MKDDYLWDRSGEPDADIEQLEERLSSFRYRERAFELKSAPRRPSWNWAGVAAAAAIGVAVLAASLWLILGHRAGARDHRNGVLAKLPLETVPPKVDSPPVQVPKDVPSKEPGITRPVGGEAAPRTRYSNRLGAGRWKDPSAVARFVGDPSMSPWQMPQVEPGDASAQRLVSPTLIDPDTVRHIEGAQALLLSFKNSTAEGRRDSIDVSEERNRSRGMLSSNILLRRNAEQRGNIPVQELLGNLEPFLLDIAHLSDKPSPNDVRVIQERIKRDEILVALESYSSPALSQAF
jgi:hypothetical protein